MQRTLPTLIAAVALATLAACGRTEAPPPAADSTAATPAAPEAAPPAQPEPAAPAAAMAPKPTPSKPATKPANQPPPVPVPAPAPAPVVVVVPAGTQLPLVLDSDLSSKTAKVGDAVSAHLTSDVRVGERTAIAAGTTVAGTVTTVVSGSDKIGGTPTLGLSFDRVQMPGGKDIPISGDLVQKGKSDAARDTAKIVGGAAAGAILGHQVKGGDKGKVIGGLLGGAIGAVAAQKTGTEVKIAAGTEIAITLGAPVEIEK